MGRQETCEIPHAPTAIHEHKRGVWGLQPKP